jgi:hypothetical protein
MPNTPYQNMLDLAEAVNKENLGETLNKLFKIALEEMIQEAECDLIWLEVTERCGCKPHSVSSGWKAYKNRSLDKKPPARRSLDIPYCETTAEEREAKFKSISSHFGMSVTQIIRYPVEPYEYTIEIEGQIIKLGEVENLTSQIKFRNIIFKYLKARPQKLKNELWEIIVDAMGEISEDEIIPGTTQEDQFEYQIEAYLDQSSVKDGYNYDVLVEKVPFVHDGELYIAMEEFCVWVSTKFGEKHTNTKVIKFLTEVEARQTKKKNVVLLRVFTANNKLAKSTSQTRRYYRVPKVFTFGNIRKLSANFRQNQESENEESHVLHN